MSSCAVLFAAFCLQSAVVPSQSQTFDLQLQAPIATWDEGLPLGNGELGALVWGDSRTLKFSLDRGDLWDLRHAPETFEKGFTYDNLLRLVEAKNTDEIARLFDAPYDRLTPTKLPGLRLEIDLPPSTSTERFDLSFGDGLSTVETSNGLIRSTVARDEPVLVGEADCPVTRFRFLPPTILKDLKYPPAELGEEVPEIRKGRGGGIAGTGQWIIQATKGDLVYAAYLKTQKIGGTTRFAVSFVTNAHDVDAFKRARQLANSALKRGFDRTEGFNSQWWKRFWSVSSVTVPDEEIQKQYRLAMYLYGSGAKVGQPPIPLQGLWTADDGGLPPWKGDFHHDLNTQLIYWPYLAAGHLDVGRGLLDFLWSQLPAYRRYAREFYRTVNGPGVGAAIPGVAALDGTPLAGWGMYANSATMGPWLSLAFVDYWKTTGDIRFLRERAYPFCAEIGQSLRTLLVPDQSGRLVLPWSSSPEIHDNSLRAFLKPNSNFDLAVLRTFFDALTEMSAQLGKKKESTEWAKLGQGLGPLWVDKTGLKVSQDEDLTESHRHFSHMIAIHPFGLISIEGSDSDRRVIDESLAHIKELGTQAWCGYSFAWAACIYARCGRPEEALENLKIYADAFVLRNGFHANGDQSGRGYSAFKYRPFTLEGNFAAAQAVHEMLLQSWGGVIRLFPSTPWPSARFENLRAEGGFVVSAELSDGEVVSAKILATISRTLIVHSKTRLHWVTPKGLEYTNRLEVNLNRGEQVVAKP